MRVFAVSLAVLLQVDGQYPPLPPRPPPPDKELPAEIGWFEAIHGFSGAHQAPEAPAGEPIPLAKPSVNVKDEVHIAAMIEGRPTKELLRISLTMYARCTECFLGYVHVGGDPKHLYMEEVEESLRSLEDINLNAVVSRLGVLCQPCFEEVLANPSTMVPLPSHKVHVTRSPKPEAQQKATGLPKDLKSTNVPVPFAESIPKIPILGGLSSPRATLAPVPAVPRTSSSPNSVWKAEVAEWAPLPASWVPLPLPEVNPKILPRPSGQALAAPIEFGEFDRLGYIRFRKAASTSLQNHLLMKGGVEFCTQKCDFQSCLYANTCNVTLKCEKEDMQLDGYPCSHMGLDMVAENYRIEKERWANVYRNDSDKLQQVRDGRLFYITVLRDPIKRVISEFFYAKHANVTQDWKGMYPEKIRPSIIAGDLKQFAEFGDMNVAMNRMSLQIIKRDYPEPLFFKPVPPNASPEMIQELREAHMQGRRHLISSALHYLRQCRIVLIAEYLSQGLMLLRHVLGKDSTFYWRPLVIRKSPKDQVRVGTEQNPEVLSALTKASWADQMLYAEAKEMFFAAFQAMLESRGEVVTDIHAALAKYHVPAYGVKTSRSSEFPGVKDEEATPDGFEIDGNHFILVPQPVKS